MVPLRLKIDESFFLPEERDGYLVSAEMKKVWAVELDLLNEFSRVCTEQDLKWFVHAGTMLGAVRHHGFIPWDDDIDIVMPRSDYDRFCHLAPFEFSFPYFFQNEVTDRFFARNFSRLRNSATTALQENERMYNFPYNQGIFIDIFPLDNVPDDPRERNKFFEELSELNTKAWQWRNMIHFYHPKRGKGIAKRIKYFLKHFYFKYVFKGGYQYYLDKHHGLVTKYNTMETGWIGESIISPLGRHLWKKEWVEETIPLSFEMLQVPVPNKFDECLTASFGDWKTPKHNPTMHGGVFFDTECSYKDHLKQNKHV